MPSLLVLFVLYPSKFQAIQMTFFRMLCCYSHFILTKYKLTSDTSCMPWVVVLYSGIDCSDATAMALLETWMVNGKLKQHTHTLEQVRVLCYLRTPGLSGLRIFGAMRDHTLFFACISL